MLEVEQVLQGEQELALGLVREQVPVQMRALGLVEKPELEPVQIQVLE